MGSARLITSDAPAPTSNYLPIRLGTLLLKA